MPLAAASMAARVRERIGLEVTAADFLEFDPPPGELEAYDVVCLRHVLEHLPDAHAAMTRVRALTRPGGFFLAEGGMDECRVEPHAVAFRTQVGQPRDLGAHPSDGEIIVASNGRFGPYVKHGDEFRSLEDGDDVQTITLFASDKRRATEGQWRVAEAKLYLS